MLYKSQDHIAKYNTFKQYLSIRKNNKLKGYEFMAVHHGGKVGNAAGILANPKSTKQEKRKASQVLNEHKKKKH